MFSAIHPFVKRVGVAVAAVVLVWLAVGGALAQDPPDKDDSKVSPLLRELLASAQQPSAASQQSQVPAADGGDGGVTREVVVDRLGSKLAPPADEPQDELIRVDADGNVQVYLYMDSMSEEALAELRELDARIEIVNARWGVIQAWIPATALDDFAALDVVDEVTLPGLRGHAGRLDDHGRGRDPPRESGAGVELAQRRRCQGGRHLGRRGFDVGLAAWR